MGIQMEAGSTTDTREGGHATEPEFHVNTDKLIRNAASTMLVIVVLASATMSWKGLVELGNYAGMGWAAALLPIAIDGMLLLGSLETLHAVLGKRKSNFGGLLTLVGVSLSIGGNMISAYGAGLGWLAASIHAIPPLMLFLSLSAFERIVKHRITVEKAVERKNQRKAAVKPLSGNASRGHDTPKKAVKPVESKPVAADTGVTVEVLQGILDDVDPEASKAAKVEAMLLAYPDTRTGVLASALGCDTKQVGTTIARVRKRVEVQSLESGASESSATPLYAVS